MRSSFGLMVLLVVACGSDRGPGMDRTGPYDTVPRDRAAADTAATLCGLLTGCGCDREIFGSAGECTMGATTYYQNVYQTAEDAGLIYDPDCLATVLNAYNEDIGCRLESELASGAIRFTERYCKVFYGTKGEGETCERFGEAFGDECMQGMHCLGTCNPIPEPRPIRAEGEPCDPATEVCELGTLCLSADLAGADPICRRGPGLGDECFGALVCEEGFCDTDAGRCEPWPAVGMPCGPGSFSDSRCAEGAYCGDTEVCVALPGEGERCAEPFLDVRCGAGLFCQQDAEGAICRPTRAEGESCEDVRSDEACGALVCRDDATNTERCLPEEALVCI